MKKHVLVLLLIICHTILSQSEVKSKKQKTKCDLIEVSKLNDSISSKDKSLYDEEFPDQDDLLLKNTILISNNSYKKVTLKILTDKYYIVKDIEAKGKKIFRFDSTFSIQGVNNCIKIMDITKKYNSFIHKNISTLKEKPVSYTNIMPEFPTGEEGLYNYLQKLKLPESINKKSINKIINAYFIIEKDGRTSEVYTNYNYNEELTKNIKEHMLNMPAWKPGSNGSVNVRVKTMIPFTIISEGESN